MVSLTKQPSQKSLKFLIYLLPFISTFTQISFLDIVFGFVCLFFGLHPWHLEVPRLGVELELQLPAYVIATAMQVPRHICNLHHSSLQCQILNPLSEARDGIHIFMEPSRVHYC